jgi:hypothetical protein
MKVDSGFYDVKNDKLTIKLEFFINKLPHEFDIEENSFLSNTEVQSLIEGISDEEVYSTDQDEPYEDVDDLNDDDSNMDDDEEEDDDGDANAGELYENENDDDDDHSILFANGLNQYSSDDDSSNDE